MPSILRLARLATLPETRTLIVAVATSTTVRDVARRVRTDRAGLVRELKDPAVARGLVLGAATHPATRELATAGLVLIPGRYLPAGWVASWAAREAYRRYADPLAGALDARFRRPARSMKNVTPRRVENAAPDQGSASARSRRRE